MSIAFIVIALVVLVSAAVAMMLNNLIHSALLLVVSWAGIALFYLWAGAQFAGFAQVLVYVGAISMVVLFAVLLTRRSHADASILPAGALPGRWMSAVLAGSILAGVLVGAVLSTPLEVEPREASDLTVHRIGTLLMGRYAPALLVVGVLLTVALLGAVVIAGTEPHPPKENAP